MSGLVGVVALVNVPARLAARLALTTKRHALTTPAGRRYARTGGPDVRPSQAVSLFVVERGMPGFSLGQRLKDK